MFSFAETATPDAEDPSFLYEGEYDFAFPALVIENNVFDQYGRQHHTGGSNGCVPSGKSNPVGHFLHACGHSSKRLLQPHHLLGNGRPDESPGIGTSQPGTPGSYRRRGEFCGPRQTIPLRPLVVHRGAGLHCGSASGSPDLRGQ